MLGAELPRERKELEAESVAFVTCEAMGIDSSNYTFGYVAGWAGGSAEAIAGIRESGERISRAAKQIIEGVGTAGAMGEEVA